MRPVYLEMKGFANFREHTTVDFRDVEYFALVGPTGAGKSTIVDGILFALYGTVPRWENAKSLGSALAPTVNHGAVRLVFDLGARRYQVARSLRRRPDGGVSTQEARLEQLTDTEAVEAPISEQAIPLAAGARELTAAVEDLIGLDFDRFTKCVVLPQGQFAELLHAEPKTRRAILSDLLGYDKYRHVSRAARTRSKQAETQQQEVTTQLADLPADPAAALAAAQTAADTAEELSRQVEQHLDAAQATAQKLEELTRVATQQQTDVDLLDTIQPPEGLDQLAADHQQAQEGAEAALAAFEAAQDRLSASQAQLQSLPGPQEIEPILTARADLSAATSELAKLTDELEQAQAAATAAETTAQGAETERDAARAAADKAKERLAQLIEEQQQLRSRLDVIDALPTSVDLTVLEDTRKAVQAAEQSVRDAEQAVTAARDADHAAALRAHLHVGDACPVCGHHIDVLPEAQTPALAHAEQHLTEARHRQEQAQQAHSGADRDLTSALVDAWQAAAVLTPPALPSEQDVPQRWQAFLSWTDQQRADAPSLDVTHLEKAQDSATAAATAAANAATAFTQARKDAADTAATYHSLVGRVNAQNNHVEELRQRADDPRTDTELQTLLADYRTADQDAKDATSQFEQARLAAAEAKTALDRLTEQMTTARSEFTTTWQRVAYLQPPEFHDDTSTAKHWAALTGWAVSHAQQVREALAVTTSQLDTITATRDRQQQELNTLWETHPDLPPPPAINDPGGIRTVLQRHTTGLAGDLRVAETQQKQHSRLLERQTQLAETQAVASQLANLLRDDQFPAWLIRSAFTSLLLQASSTLTTLSGGQFSLSQDGDDLVVIDHFDADSVRNVKTLSGGETFQASLALALALASHISALSETSTVNLDTIIIDEGFGSLDQASLDEVATTLETLTSTGERLVGVVTHVAGLAERVPTQYQVDKAQSGSHVSRGHIEEDDS